MYVRDHLLSLPGSWGHTSPSFLGTMGCGDAMASDLAETQTNLQGAEHKVGHLACEPMKRGDLLDETRKKVRVHHQSRPRALASRGWPSAPPPGGRLSKLLLTRTLGTLAQKSRTSMTPNQPSQSLGGPRRGRLQSCLKRGRRGYSRMWRMRPCGNDCVFVCSWSLSQWRARRNGCVKCGMRSSTQRIPGSVNFMLLGKTGISILAGRHWLQYVENW